MPRFDQLNRMKHLVESECSIGYTVGNAEVPYFIFGVVELVTMAILLVYLVYPKFSNARNRPAPLVLPIYYMTVLFTVFVGICTGLISVIGVLQENVYFRVVKWFLYRLVADGLAIFLLHNGVGQKALKHAFWGALLWSTTSSISQILLYTFLGYEYYVVCITILIVFLFTFYTSCWMLPQECLHKRPPLLSYAKKSTFVLLIFITVYILLLRDFDRSSCAVQFCFAAVDILQPFAALRALREDSMFWQGLYENATISNLNQPLLGIWSLESTTVSVVTESICQLERKVVPIIPFGAISIDTSKQYFSGGNARVYRGRHKDSDGEVAIKILFCIELTPDRVIDFCNEATLLNSLQHPNIVTCLGVAVMPPALCLVTEFCHYGSLYDFLHKYDFSEADDSLIKECLKYRASTKSGIRPAGQLVVPTLQSEDLEDQEILHFGSRSDLSEMLINAMACEEGEMQQGAERKDSSMDEDIHRTSDSRASALASHGMLGSGSGKGVSRNSRLMDALLDAIEDLDRSSSHTFLGSGSPPQPSRPLEALHVSRLLH